MIMFYSPENNSFLPGDLKKVYEKAGSWPTDAKEVSYEVFQEFSLHLPPSPDLQRVSDRSGMPSWKEIEQTLDFYHQEETSWVLVELSRIRDELEKVQDSDSKSVGSVSDWRGYRKALRVWPESPNFPNKEFRPKAPDAK